MFVECFGLKPCWVGDNGMCGIIRFSMSRSMTLKAVLSSVLGLHEVRSGISSFNFARVGVMSSQIESFENGN